MDIEAFDAHVHCGPSLPFERVEGYWQRSNIRGGVMFSPVEEIYDRYDPSFVDSAEYALSRRESHEYLLNLARSERIFPYFFVWNDFAEIPEGFFGIKWHRHENEPVYDYNCPGCEQVIEEICRRRLPVVLEEELHNTVDFIDRINERTVVIIPHMGGLNGGYAPLRDRGVFENPMVWADTALGAAYEIEDFANRYGVERILFGSDFPFGLPPIERQKVERIFSGSDLEAALKNNLLRLLGRWNED